MPIGSADEPPAKDFKVHLRIVDDLPPPRAFSSYGRVTALETCRSLLDSDPGGERVEFND
jgi:hypothetical protein